jgi:HlyD family secretion protein
VLGVLCLLVAAGGGAAWFFMFRGPQVRTDLVTNKVEYKDLQLKIVERGALEAANNHDVKCEVRPGLRTNPKIMSVADNGKLVEKGELLVVIDDSGLQEQAQTQKVVRDKAESDKIAAEEKYPVTQVNVKLAELNLERWEKGDYLQKLHDFEGQIQIAESDLLQQQERASWAARMVKKGYMTASQEEAEQSRFRGYQLNLLKLQEQKKVLTEYENQTSLRDLGNKILDAKSQEKQALADRESKRLVFKVENQKYNDYQEDIKNCKIYAPSSGLVVYYTPEQTRSGSGATQSIIAQGEPVQYGQKLMSIPDLAHMQVNVRIHEAFINYMKDGLPSLIRVDAAPQKLLKGHVKMVANIASPQDWMSPDVKVYQALVEIDDSVEGMKLKPGLSAQVTVFSESKVEHVLAVPLQAIVSPLEKGKKPRCFVITPTGPEARDVEVGLNDEKLVEIKDGLQEGEDVVLNPRALLSDKEKKATKEDDKINPDRKGGAKPGAPGDKGKPNGTPSFNGAGGGPGRLNKP